MKLSSGSALSKKLEVRPSRATIAAYWALRTWVFLMQSELLHNAMPMIDTSLCVFERNIKFQAATGYVDLSKKKRRKNWKVPSRIASNATESSPIPIN